MFRDGVDGVAIRFRRGRHVVRALESALDLETNDSCFDQIGDEFVSREVLWAQEVCTIAKIADLTVGDKLIRQPARLCTLATIGATTAEGFAREALSRVSNAKRAVNEYF